MLLVTLAIHLISEGLHKREDAEAVIVKALIQINIALFTKYPMCEENLS